MTSLQLVFMPYRKYQLSCGEARTNDSCKDITFLSSAFIYSFYSLFISLLIDFFIFAFNWFIVNGTVDIFTLSTDFVRIYS